MINTSLEFPSPNSSTYIIRTRKKVKENRYCRRLSPEVIELDLSIDECLKDESFDIMPKTDYTYSRSGSYSPNYLDDDYISPNMSRRKLRGSAIYTPEATGQYSKKKIIVTDTSDYTDIGNSYIDARTEYSDDEREDLVRYNNRLNEDIVNTRRSRYLETDDGMTLRSGSHLHGVKAVIDSHNQNTNALTTDRKTRFGAQSNYIDTEIITETTTTYSTSPSDSEIKQRLNYDDTTNNEVIEKGSAEISEKFLRRRSKRLKDSSAGSHRSSLSTNSSINHLYGLDSEEEYSDIETTSVYSSQDDETIFESFMLIWSAVSGYFTDLIKNIFYVATGLISYVASGLIYPVWSKTKSLFSGSSSVSSSPSQSSRSSAASSSRLYDSQSVSSSSMLHKISEKQKKRKGSCCLWLPCCLFLLPLLLLLGLYNHDKIESVSRTYFLPLIWADKNDTIIKVSEFDTYNLNSQVKNIVYQLQGQQATPLSQSEIEVLIRGILEKELSALRLNLISQMNSLSTDQTTNNMNYNDKLSSLEALLAAAQIKATSLEEDISQAKLYANMKDGEINQETILKIQQLEQKFKDLGVDIGVMKQAQLDMMASVKNCCHNESYYTASVRQEIHDILAGMMTGGGGSGDSKSDHLNNMFMTWLHGNYISKDEFDSKMAALADDITAKILNLEKTNLQQQQIVAAAQSQKDSKEGGLGGLGESYVRTLIKESLLKFSADTVGMADYALESGGGSLISVRCTETYYERLGLVSMFGIPLWHASKSPRTVIQPNVHPGECWAFKGTQGCLVLQLSYSIIPSGFTLEHIPKALSPSGDIISAPRDFAVYGLEDEYSTQGTSLGNYTYRDDDVSVQYFPVQVPNPPVFKFIELKILNNYGNIVYTCLYRFRVHGTPV